MPKTTRNWTNSNGSSGSYLVFKPDAAYAKRWNNDNQPRPENWPKN